MSASKKETAIWTTDDPETVKRKINKYAFSGGQPTIKEHRCKGGNPEIDVRYQWLTFFEENDKKLENIYNKYKSGELLTGELKAILIDKINKLLKTHRTERLKAEKKVDSYIFKN